MARRGISEKVRYAYNPLPKVKEADLLERAGLKLIRPSPLDPFEFVWQYGSGADGETVVIQPGDFLPLRSDEMSAFLKKYAEQGGVAVDDPSDKAAVKQAAREGLIAAAEFWRQRGSMRLLEQQKGRGFTDDQMEQWKHNFWAYHLAAAREQAVMEAIEKMDARAAKSA